MKTFAIRLKPNADLKQSLSNFAKQQNIQAGFILSAIGSLKQAKIRFADQDASVIYEEKLEILSLNGTLATTGVHLHLAIADRFGKTIGGHLVDGCIIYTTAEIIIGESTEFVFNRSLDPETGYQELDIIQIKN
ncbi:MAG TPA: PPC domain-containing DNA-binding protein [Nostocaceae cyanobacterium]|nr:PPC domain-containing DNA-binding protein [Nostocaceae cyanobacterium]